MAGITDGITIFRATNNSKLKKVYEEIDKLKSKVVMKRV